MNSENKKDIINFKKKSYIALGSFDGIHIGHNALVDKVLELSKFNDCESVIYTFSNHPRKFIKPDLQLKLLLDNKTKIEILKSKGIDIIYFEEFNKEFMSLKPEEFIKYLIKKFNISGIVVGFNYKFGYKNLGDTEVLKKLSVKYGYKLYIMEPYKYRGKVVSSTRIRNELIAGNLIDSKEMLGRPYILRGIVEDGKKIGRTIGFPTANIKYEEKLLLPKVSVYYTNIIVNNKRYKGITNIGTNPTVNGEKITVETHILDFDEDIYGCEIIVMFFKKIREQKKFSNLEELKLQLKKDKEFAKHEKLYK